MRRNEREKEREGKMMVVKEGGGPSKSSSDKSLGQLSARGKRNNGADGGLGGLVHTTGQSFYYFRFILYFI